MHLARVGFADCVGGGHLFHPKMLGIFHEAYEALLEKHGTSLERVLRERLWGAPLARASVAFTGEIPRYGTALEIEVQPTRVRNSRLTIGYRARDSKSGAEVATGSTVHAFLDLATFRRVPIPPSVETMLATFPSLVRDDAPPESDSGLRSAPSIFTHRISISFDAIDAAGFVYFAKIPGFFHHAHSEMRRKAGTEPVTRVLTATADFLRPLRAGDEVDVSVVSLTETSAGFRASTPGGEPLATGTMSHA